MVLCSLWKRNGGLINMIELAIRGLFFACSGLLWRFGGAKGFTRAYRWLFLPILTIVYILILGNPLMLFSIPLRMGAYSLGYGESSFIRKLIGGNNMVTRLICGMLYAIADIFIFWGNWWLFGFHFLILAIGVMLAGSQKFKTNDKKEEFFIGSLTSVCPIIGF